MTRLLVSLQFLTIGLLLWPVPVVGSRGWAVSMGFLGAIWLAWAVSANRPGNFNVRPEPKAGASLVTSGPYRWIRHPMYTGVLLMTAGAVVGWPVAWKALAWLALAGTLIAKARREERSLLIQFPDYAAYRRGRWFLVPGIW